ncbi:MULTISPECIES: hypothetical protein [unclassified Colwellia]|jgi:hypothetical protein|uniref:hypothetical protein n=1 Tax=unclassified Colwellia TaxID=196834 RepID=UPI0015F581F5|nr:MULTISPECIES: hypothetical protein [unclassified Colwellia]MBA6363053.1 hypothetical protein [Colwellia sp. BRX8-8]MBA6338538.1 hypothetical protein [Colwellia sp. BRX8-7]MBA6346499.1 hypothetical protein [Colwellia sp. BRX8-9]MBA6353332.1 hypothetical protein [Colwellia sp. BRX9-1]MBA6355755.1 hypothetical protein [Colwellia sp. BRX8-3]
MGSHHTNQNKHATVNFSALKTAIGNGEALLIKNLLANQSMQDLEKKYLINLAYINNNPSIIELLEGIPVKE